MLGRANHIPNLTTVFKTTVRGKAKGVVVKNPSADFLPYKGKVAGPKSQRVELQAGKSYLWCSCGLSVNQPFCDGTHKAPGLTNARPVEFQVEKSGTYGLCACKQTNTRPICDGAHKTEAQAARDDNTSRYVAFDESPVYDGVARKLGYKTKNGGFQ